MKRILAIILTLAMALSAAACGKTEHRESKRDSHTNTEHTAPVGEPTEEELTQLRAYAESVMILEQWANGELEDVYFYNEETGRKQSSGLEFGLPYASGVLEYHYNVISGCTAVDKWAGTEWTSDPAVNWDRQEVLDAFTIVEDVALYEFAMAYDHLDNLKEKAVCARYFYNEEGQLTTVKPGYYPNALQMVYPFEFVETLPTMEKSYQDWTYEYNDKGQQTVLKTLYPDGGVQSKVTATYNADGTLATLTEMTDKGETTTATVVCDGQLVKEIQVTGQEQRVYSYEYDAKGNLITAKEVCNIPNNLTEHLEIVTEVYSYSKDGKLESCERTEGVYYGGELSYETKDVYTYECDDQCRPVKATVVPGDKMNVKAGEVMHGGEADYAKAEHTLVYGDYYIYGGK